MTTNERFNARRYKHFQIRKGSYSSPFNAGFVNNFKNFFCTKLEQRKKTLISSGEREKFIVWKTMNGVLTFPHAASHVSFNTKIASDFVSTHVESTSEVHVKNKTLLIRDARAEVFPYNDVPWPSVLRISESEYKIIVPFSILS